MSDTSQGFGRQRQDSDSLLVKSYLEDLYIVVSRV